MTKELRSLVLQVHSKAQMLRIVQWIGTDPMRIHELVQLFLSEEVIITQRSGYPSATIAIQHPELIRKYLKKIISLAQKPGLHHSVRRHTTKILEQIQIPNSLKGKVMTMCFDFLTDPHEQVGVKAYSLAILGHMLDDHPDIGQELILIIEDQWHRQSPAFKYRARKILHKMNSPLP